MKTATTICAILMIAAIPASVVPNEVMAGFTYDAQPRLIQNNVTITVNNADQSTSPVRIEIVDVSGRVIEQLSGRIRRLPGVQSIPVETANWSKGMYLVVATDEVQRGVIKLLKLE